MGAGVKQYVVAAVLFMFVDAVMIAAHAAGWSDFWFGQFARGQMGGFILGAVYWTRNPLWERR
jgi:hypothetical protein